MRNVQYLDNDTCADATGVVVVIDVLRAFSTAAYWLAGDVSEILLVASHDAAYAMRDRFPDFLLMTDSHPLPEGYELTNSPVHASQRDLRGRRIVQRTNADTVGATRCTKDDVLLCASFVVAQATADYIRQEPAKDISFVVTRGDEDKACTEYIAALLHGRGVRDHIRRQRATVGVGGRLRRSRRSGSRSSRRGLPPVRRPLCLRDARDAT